MNTTTTAKLPSPTADPVFGWMGMTAGERLTDFSQLKLGKKYLYKSRGVGQFPEVWAHNVVIITEDFREDAPFPKNRPLVYAQLQGAGQGTFALWDFLFESDKQEFFEVHVS